MNVAQWFVFLLMLAGCFLAGYGAAVSDAKHRARKGQRQDGEMQA